MARDYFDTLQLEERVRINLWVTVAAVLVAWTALLLFVVYQLRAAEVEEARFDFNTHTEQVTRQVGERLRIYAEVLRGGSGLFHSGRPVSRNDWYAYVRELALESEFPGILGFGMADRLKPAELASHESAMRREGIADFRVHPAGRRDEYTSIRYIEPFVGANVRAIGYDMFAEPTRRAAMELARDSSLVTLSAPLKLVQDGAGKTVGFLMFKAWYPLGTDPDNRAASLRGYIFSSFRAAEFMAPLAREMRPDIGLRVLDQGIAGALGSRVYSSDGDWTDASALFTREQVVRFGGREWLLQFRSLPALEEGIDYRRSELVSVAGLVVGLLLALLVGYNSFRRDLAESAARAMTGDLRASEARYRALTELSTDWFWEQGSDLRFRHVSGGRYSRNANIEAMIGKLPWEMHYHWTDAERDVFRARFEAHESIREVELMVTPDVGEPYWVSVSAEPQFDETGSFAGYRGTAREISDRKRAEQALVHHSEHLQELVAERTAGLAAAKEAAEQANRAKSEFLANMSHELRTPLHAILSFARLGIGRTGDPAAAKLKNYFSNIGQAGERLLVLVNDLLDLSKIEAGRMELNRSDTDLVALARGVAEEYSAMAEERGIHLLAPETQEPAMHKVDAARMGQVVRNLVSNALKFSPAGATVVIEVAAAEMAAGRRAADQGQRVPAWAVRVIDSGIGIPEHELDAIFDKFVQSSKTNTGAGGTGLGLAICREIVGAHRGTIAARNRPEGGAVFEILLPRWEGS